ncbi:MAG: hypothetical protein AVDCRST_MAG77-3720 [uncultured Chloroflexi bacterium]|uniref:Uncharacterized protein n=1 Tax=uncultured Chloroflexota bacterium TaxID=166587 RepID=A0A6J4J0P6_9CHLR|nr:MAG: hypothetical protein AVDCRST_MAG77-3720 [uncultured Chloroflexota bacterium]
MTRSELHDLVDDLPEDAVDGAAMFLKQVVQRRIDPDQLWFWSPEWQAKEREVDAGIASGEPGTLHKSDEDFLAALQSRVKPAA